MIENALCANVLTDRSQVQIPSPRPLIILEFYEVSMSNSPKPDFRAGIGVQDLPDGTIIQGRIDADDAILVRRGEDYFAVGAQCTHYHAALASGLVVDGTIRCPQHH